MATLNSGIYILLISDYMEEQAIYGALNKVVLTEDGNVRKTYQGDLKYRLKASNPLLLGHLRPYRSHLQRKEREEGILKSLGEDGEANCVPTLLDSDENSITMSVIKGDNLDLVYRRERDTERVKKLVRNSAKSLRRIHDAGFYHADAIPKNAIVNPAESDKVYFFDFECEYKQRYEKVAKSIDALVMMFRTSVLRDDLSITDIRKEFESVYGPVDTSCLESLGVRTGILKYGSQGSVLKSIRRYRSFKREFMGSNKNN